MAKDTNSFRNQMKRVGAKLASAAAPAKAAIERGAAERRSREAAKKPAAPSAPTRVMGATKAETQANMDAVKARRTSTPMAPLKQATASKAAGQAQVSMAKGAQSKMIATGQTDSRSGSVATKGGDFPVYKKKSPQAQSFNSAFAAARKSGAKEFTWNGRSYNTKVK